MNTKSTSELKRSFLPNRLSHRLDQLDRTITHLMARYGLRLLSISMGLVFVWFGALKLAGMSPAEPLIRDTLDFLPTTLVNPLILLLALWEVGIGVGFLSGKAKRLVLLMLLLQMAGAMSPLILAPERLWEIFPFVWTLEGQYVFKDIILISAGLAIGATHRRHRVAVKPFKHETPILQTSTKDL